MKIKEPITTKIILEMLENYADMLHDIASEEERSTDTTRIERAIEYLENKLLAE